jgi:TonB family protein
MHARELRHCPVFQRLKETVFGNAKTCRSFFRRIKDGAEPYSSFIPSLWMNPQGMAENMAALRTRRIEAGAVSFVIHAMFLSLAILGIWHNSPKYLVEKSPLVFLGSPMHLPFNLDTGEGGGGGGGKHEQLPASGGRMPDARRIKLIPPDPEEPRPILNPESDMALNSSIQLPIEFTTDSTLPIGDISAPLSSRPSSGNGSGGGIGDDGSGTGIGPGHGPGYGPGANGGVGGGPNGGMSSGPGAGVYGVGLTLPEIIEKPLPFYTEEARRSRTEGVVVLQVMIRANGSVDSIRVIRGLGHGLDESAIHTVSTKWRFKPARFRGVPIDIQAVIEVNFRLL